LVLAQARAYAPFAEGLQRLGRRGWIDGREIVVVCPGDDVFDEALRLHLSSLRSRAGDRYRELQLPPTSVVREAEAPSGLERRFVEALSVAGRPLSERLLRQAFAMEPPELSAVVAALVRADRVDALVGHHDEAPSVAQLILDVRPGARLVPGPERRHEVRLLVSSSLENVAGRGAAGRAWLRAESATRVDPGRALTLLRAVRERARKDGLHLLEYSAGERIVQHAAVLHPRQEDRVQAAICMGEQHRLHGEIQRADEILGSALQELEMRTDTPTSRIAPLACELTLKLGMLAMHRANYPLAEERLTEVLERYKDDLAVIHRARIYLDLSWALLQIGRTRECMSYCELTLKLLDTERYPAEVARAYNQLGFAQYKESDYDQSVRNHQRCLVLREQLDDELAVARSYNNLALSYRALGRLTEAERCLRQSLELKKRAGDNLGRAASGLNLGFVFLDQGRPSAARERAEECLELARELQNLEMEAEASGLLGEIAMAEGDLREARRLLRIDLEICERTGHRSEQLATLRRLVSVLLELEELDEAATCLEGARTLQQEQPSRYEAGMLDRLEAELLVRTGAVEPAIDLFAAAARTLGSLRRREQQLDCLARKGQEELGQGRVLESRTTLGEAQDLIARHEIHRIPLSLNRLSASLESFSADAEPPGAGRCLSALADMLTAGGGIQQGRVESALLGLRTALACEQLYWIPDEQAKPRRLEGTGLVETTLPPELVGRLDPESTGEEIVRHENWLALRLGLGGSGWLALSRLKALDPDELAFARSVAGVLNLVREAGTNVGSHIDEEVGGALDTGVEERLVARSEAMRQVLRTVDTIGDHDVTVLILGENGTGKDVVARAIHESGPRREHEFVAVNCASIPPSLLESELFGHERGAFTSAYDRRIGVFERAHGGTIFLDEIGDMSLDMQAKLLRVLQDKSFSRVGGSETLRTDVRILAATNRDLRQEVAQGRFRMDLFYRLNVITIELPPLRERAEDIEPLVDHFLRKFGPELGSRVRAVSAEALARLRAYTWPGNVRELENVLKSAMVFGSGEILRPEELPAAVLAERGRGGGPTVEEAVRSIVATDDCTAERPLMPRVELLLVHEMVRRTGNKTLAAKLLGITKPTLYNRLRRFRALYGTPDEEAGD
jgi:DNA-binding NtrC family response regulator/tetratricopeptide (TPR) repeat protein